ncbi:MAG TPA: efflux transporter periplasmic adaptor subunit, partial [Acinetobacter sp.]|nr:efflux transporter periplasmic adaptor subunit [Acinetobacter sp.]
RTPTGQAMAMIVDAKGAIESRPVTTVGVQGQNWIVTEGIKTGEKVVVDGVAKVKAGQTVSAKPYQPQTEASKASAPASAGKPQAKQAESNTEQKATSHA